MSTGIKSVHDRLQLGLFKLETTYATDPTPAVTDAIAVRGIKMDVDIAQIKRPRFTHLFSSQNPVPGRVAVPIEIEMGLEGVADPGENPLTLAALDRLLLCSLMARTSSGSPISQYQYAIDHVPPHDSMTIARYLVDNDGQWFLQKALGCRFTWEFNASTEDEAKFMFKGFGLYSAPANASAPATPTYLGDPLDGSVYRAINLLVGGVELPCKSINIKSNVVVNPILNTNSPFEGVSHIHPTVPAGDTIEVSIEPEMRAPGVYNFWSKAISAGLETFELACDTVRGSRWIFESDFFQYGTLSQEPDNGIFRLKSTGYLGDNGSANALTIRFQRAA